MTRLLTNVVAVMAIMFTGQLTAHPAAYAETAPTVKQCQQAYAGLAALTRAGWPRSAIAANEAIIDQKCAGVVRR